MRRRIEFFPLENCAGRTRLHPFSCQRWAQVNDEYLEQLTGEKKIIVRDKRTRTKKAIYVKTYNRNEALDLTVYCYAALFCLQNVIDPTTFRDLGFLNQAILRTKQSLTSLAPDRKRKFRSRGV